MKNRSTQLQTGKIPYATVYGQYIKNALRKRVAGSERTGDPTETEESEFLKPPDIRIQSFGPPPSFDLRVRNRFSFNENQ